MTNIGLTLDDLEQADKEQTDRLMNQKDAAAKRVEDYVKKGGRVNRVNHRFLFFISGAKPLTDRADMEALSNMFCKNRTNIKYIEIGTPEQGNSQLYHQHCLIILDENFRFYRRPTFIAKDGTVYTICFTNANNYTVKTGDLNYYLKYMRKNGTEDNKPYLFFDNGFIDKKTMNQETAKHKPSYDQDLITAAEMDDIQDAINYLRDRHPARFIKDENNFKNIWYGKHADELQRQALYKPGLKPFKEELEAIQGIRAFVNKTIIHPNWRTGNLFIVGPSKLGKTEFIIQEIYLKYPCFMIHGDFDFSGYNEEKDYKFIIFDDVNYMRADNLERIRSLTSTVNHQILINIKYGKKLVKSRPIIHIVNKHQYDNIQYTIWRSGSGDWWRQNSTVVEVTEPLFDKKAKPIEGNEMEEVSPEKDELELPKTPGMTQEPQELPSRPTTPGLPEQPKTPIEQKEIDDIEKLMNEKETNEKPPKPPKSDKYGLVKKKPNYLEICRMVLPKALPDDLMDRVVKYIDDYEDKADADDSALEEVTEDTELIDEEFDEFQRTHQMDFGQYEQKEKEREDERDNEEEMPRQMAYNKRTRKFDPKTYRTFREEFDEETMYSRNHNGTSGGWIDDEGIIHN